MAESTSTDPTFIPPSQKARTLTHMNKDHQTDLQHMLQHFGGVSSEVASQNPTLVDMDLSSLTITTGRDNEKTHTVQIQPPMTAWNDRRARLVDMTMAARSALGIPTDSSPEGDGGKITLTKYYTSSFVDIVVGLAVFLYFSLALALKSGLLTPSSPVFLRNQPYSAIVYGLIDRLHPAGAMKPLARIVNLIFWPVLSIHVMEAVMMDLTRLQKYGVKRFTGVWWKWVVTTFFQGYMAFMRFDGVVAGLKKKKAH